MAVHCNHTIMRKMVIMNNHHNKSGSRGWGATKTICGRRHISTTTSPSIVNIFSGRLSLTFSLATYRFSVYVKKTLFHLVQWTCELFPRGLPYLPLTSLFFFLIYPNFSEKQCCGSGMFIPDPDFLPIPDPKTGRKERSEKYFFFQTFFCSHKFHKM